MFALLEYDPRFDAKLVKEICPQKHGSDQLHWVDLSAMPNVRVGWMLNPDGSVTPYEPPLDRAKEQQLLILKIACRRVIVGGFTSSALGAPHAYDSADTDRENLDRAAMAALTGPQGNPAWAAQIKCAEPGQDQVFVPHTSAQVHKVVSDMHQLVEGARVKLHDLRTQVAAATTVAAVTAIVW